MVKPTKEELNYCYHTLNMKQSEISKKFNYYNISRLLDKYCIEKKKRGIFKKLTTEKLLKKFENEREDNGKFYDYSQVNYINQSTKIKIICPLHGQFYQFPMDHLKNYSGCKECANLKRQQTCLTKYGVTSTFQSEKIKQKIKETNLKKYGVENPSQSSKIHQKKIKTSLKNCGYEYGIQSDAIKQKIRETNLNKYGVSSAMKLPEISKKSIETRIKNNSYIKFTSSKEAKKYIKNYIEKKNYKLEQCAFSDVENNLYEWGYFYKNKWILYDLVVFELGYRGNKEKIIEILEYHGPFHYTKNDVIERGNEKAYPWKSKKMTIKESYEIDMIKEEFAKKLTNFYSVVWSKNVKNDLSTY